MATGQLSIFVLMPFAEEFDDVYQVIRASINEAATTLRLLLRCSRADDIERPGRITDQVIEAIRLADLIIADVTGNNPNVMYELGYAHALDKHAIILNQRTDKDIFDIRDFRQIFYDRTRLMRDCSPRLVSSIAELIQDGRLRPAGRTPAQLETTEDARTIQPTEVVALWKPSSELVHKLQELDLRMQFARTNGKIDDVAKLGRELRDILDRMSITATYDPQDTHNTAAGLFNCALELERAKLAQPADDVFKRGIGLFPDYAPGHLHYADFLVDEGRISEAQVELDRVRKLDPNDARILRVETKLGLLSGEIPSQVGDKLRENFNRTPSDLGAAAAYLVFLSRTGTVQEFEQACAQWEEALPANRKQVARRALADRLATESATEHRARATNIYETLIDLSDPEDQFAVLHNLATLYDGQGDRTKAEETWRRAYRLKPSDSDVRAAFSQRLARWGKMDLAMKVLSGESMD